jgi:hypothetical protein
VITAVLLALAALPPTVGVPPQPAVPVATRVIAVPAGTPLRLTTVAAINSRSIIQGQRVTLTVGDEVTVGSQLVFPRGTPAVGEIDAVSQTGVLGKAARFTVRPLFIEVAGQRINLTGRIEQRGSSAVAAAVVTTALFGALGVVIAGKSATLPANSVVLGQIKNDVLIATAVIDPPR